jgi:hypothetical protein
MLSAARPGRPDVHVGVECGEVLVTRSWEPACLRGVGTARQPGAAVVRGGGPGELVLGPAAYAGAGHLAEPATEAVVRVRGVANPVPPTASHPAYPCRPCPTRRRPCPTRCRSCRPVRPADPCRRCLRGVIGS